MIYSTLYILYIVNLLWKKKIVAPVVFQILPSEFHNDHLQNFNYFWKHATESQSFNFLTFVVKQRLFRPFQFWHISQNVFDTHQQIKFNIFRKNLLNPFGCRKWFLCIEKNLIGASWCIERSLFHNKLRICYKNANF